MYQRTIVCHSTVICNGSSTLIKSYFSQWKKTVVQVQLCAFVYFNCYLTIHIYCFIKGDVTAYFSQFQHWDLPMPLSVYRCCSLLFRNDKSILQCNLRNHLFLPVSNVIASWILLAGIHPQWPDTSVFPSASDASGFLPRLNLSKRGQGCPHVYVSWL